MIKLIASDVDGTLLQNGAEQLSSRIIEIIQELSERGILFVAASGRQYSSLQRLFEPVKNQIAYIPENGSLCFFKGQMLMKVPIKHDFACRIIDGIRQLGNYDCIVSGEKVVYTDSQNKEFLNHITNEMHFDIQIVQNLKEDIHEPYLKVACRAPGEVERCLAQLTALFGKEISIVTAGNQWIDFIPPGTNKGIALKVLMDYLKILPEESIAFGDQYNDVEMLKAVGVSYAMSHAMPGVIKCADSISDTVEEVLGNMLKFAGTIDNT